MQKTPRVFQKPELFGGKCDLSTLPLPACRRVARELLMQGPSTGGTTLGQYRDVTSHLINPQRLDAGVPRG